MSKLGDFEKTAQQLKRETQRKNRLELNLSFQRNQLRKADIRQKIQLGGLVIKAGLADEPKALLLGLLLEAQEQLAADGGNDCRERWGARGDNAFAAHQENNAS